MFSFRPATGLLLLALSALFSCSTPSPREQSMDPGAFTYVEQYTSGLISAHSEVVVTLTEDLGAGIAPGTELEERVFRLNPAVEGRVVWKSSSSLAFVPDEPLASGQLYEVEFHLGKLREVPESIRVLTFSFQVIEQGFHVQSFRLDPYSNADFTWNQLVVNIFSNDVSSIAEVSSRLSIRGIDPDRLAWEIDDRAKGFTLLLDSIERQEAGRPLHLLDGEEVLDTLFVPSVKDFQLLDQITSQLPDQSLTLFFSSPLAADQRLEGMFQLNGEDVENAEVRGTQVILRPAAPVVGDVPFRVAQGLRNSRGEVLAMDIAGTATFHAEKPAVKFASSGHVVAGTGKAIVPISTVNLRAVDVKVYQIFENNILQFFQNNGISGSDELRSVARPVAERRIELGGEGDGRWKHFGLDLDQIIKRQPGAIYRLELNFRPSYSLYPCSDAPENPVDEEETGSLNPDVFRRDYWDPWSIPGYRYQERDNPCHVSYYTSSRKVEKNVLVSDVGLVVKGGGDTWHAYVSNISSGDAESGARVQYLNYQGQSIGTCTTNGQGKATMALQGVPFLVIATVGKEKAYLKLDRGASLSVSAFDVDGVEVEEGVRAYLYAERGIWHPGDSIHLDAILEDAANPLPEDHPLVLNVYSPSNQLVQRKVVARGKRSILPLGFQVASDAPTGTYRAELVVGSESFSKSLPVEAVQPNRLDLELRADGTVLQVTGQRAAAELSAEWLTGASAKGLHYEVKGSLSRHASFFAEKWPTYQFFDELSEVGQITSELLAEGELGPDGKADLSLPLGNMSGQPGPLWFNAYLRVYEPGGRFSIARQTLPLSPHPAYVGIRMPSPNETGWLNTNESHRVELVRVDETGKPVSGRVRVKAVRVTWNWWWSRLNGDANYLNSSSNRTLMEQEIELRDGKGSVNIEVGDDDWGRVIFVVSDLDGSHSATAQGQFDWGAGRDRSERASEDAAGIVSVDLDRDRYQVGEVVTVRVPTAAGGRLVLSLENGREQVWDQILDTQPGMTTVTFTATAAMAPHIYAHALVIQPFDGRENDLPIRLYGIVPIEVVNPELKLDVALQVPESIKPNTTLEVKVSESQGQAMEYTLAVVDEGLLNLTNFKTPDPHAAFSKRQALGVRTWDMYPWVMNAFGGRLEQVLSVGGDAALIQQQEDNSDRFQSVVAHLGPFTLDPGKTAQHRIPIGNYIGNVRVMVVAAKRGGASGNAEAKVRVKQDLMVQMTLPRQLAPEETVVVPVTVFAMKPNLGKVTVRLTGNELIDLESDRLELNFREEGQQTAYLKGRVKRAVGTATFAVNAVAGALKSEATQAVSVRYPVPAQQRGASYALDEGELVLDLVPFGIPSGHEAVLQFSHLPGIQLARHVETLLEYPHGCSEQLTSKGLALLHLGSWVELDATQQATVREFVTTALNQLRARQHPSGAFGYWPNSTYASEWVTDYVGGFLVAARAQGYDLPPGMWKAYLGYARQAARNWMPTETSIDEVQAHRLHVLALAQQPELGAMTRLMNRSTLSNAARMMLASAYAEAGEEQLAVDLLSGCTAPERTGRRRYHTFGSDVRDLATWVGALHAVGRVTDAQQLGRDLAEAMQADWLSTQEIASALHVLSSVFGADATGKLSVVVEVDGRATTLTGTRRVLELQLPNPAEAHRVVVRSEGPCFVDVIQRGIPLYGEEYADKRGLELSVDYRDLNGFPIDIGQVKVGATLTAHVRVKRTQPGVGLERMACWFMLPDGWEVTNTRLSGEVGSAGVNYQDFRDDRVMLYFDLASGQTQLLELEVIATYPGRFYLPGTYVEAMYDDQLQAAEAGRWVVVSAD